jgi:hypothetical protein
MDLDLVLSAIGHTRLAKLHYDLLCRLIQFPSAHHLFIY